MPNRNSQRGFLTVTGVIMIVVIFGAIFVAFKVLPPYISNYQFQDAINNIARTSTYDRSTSQDIQKQVMSAAAEIGIDLVPEEVVAVKSGSTVEISADYYVDVDLMVKQLELHFTPAAGNKIITAK